jgi:transcriptional regulator with GAF, ATPase, and Fis domain
MPIDLPPLKERGREDLRLLVQHFLTKVARSTNRPLQVLHPDAWAKLHGYSWPGNIWELQNVIGRAALLCRGPQITAADIEFDHCPSSDGEVASSLRRAINAALPSVQTNLASRLHDILNQELLLLTLTRCAGDQQKAERILGVPLSALLPQDADRPPAEEKNDKPKHRSPLQFQTEALLLIHNNPEWTAEEYAEKLRCSKATLYRYEAIKRALQARGGR